MVPEIYLKNENGEFVPCEVLELSEAAKEALIQQIGREKVDDRINVNGTHTFDMDKSFYAVMNTLFEGRAVITEKTGIAVSTMSETDVGAEADVVYMLSSDAMGNMLSANCKPIPDRILKSGNRTIVFWVDGTKTMVKRADDEPESEYAAFTAAYAKKVFGSNSKIRKVIKKLTEVQERKKK